MTPALPRDRHFARLLCTSADEGASGILTASRGKLRRLFCLQKGWIVFATSNLIEEQFIEYLVRSDAISPRLRGEAVEESARTKVKPVAYLLLSGNPTKDALRLGMEGLVRELLTSTLEWPDGLYRFDDGLPRLDGEVTVRMAPRSLVLAHAKRYPAAVDALRIRIGPPDLRPIAAESANARGTQMDALGAFLLERCDGTIELFRIVKDSPADEEATLRAIYGFLLAGLLEPENREARREKESLLRDDALSREECIGRLAMAAGKDHYGVLAVDRTARLKVIREAYYALARRYHPDRFRSGPLADLLPRFEDFFMLVTDAHNTLSVPLRRAVYDESLTVALAVDAKNADTGYLARQNFLRGRALAALRKYTEAVTFFENAVSLDPGQADYHLQLGLVLSRNPRHREEAERHLLQAITLAPVVVAGYLALGQMYLKAGRLGRAGRMAREALRWEPGHLEASQLLAAAGNAPDEKDDLQEGVFGTS
jgi:tetratricopeptide (TPR) repeat protein